MANKSYRKTVIIIAGQLFSSTCCCLSSCYQGFEDGKMQMATDWFEPWSNVKFFVFLQFYILNLTCDFSNSRQIVTLRFLWKIRENSLPSRIFLGGKMQMATEFLFNPCADSNFLKLNYSKKQQKLVLTFPYLRS